MRLSKARKECVTAMMRDTIFEAASSVLDQHGTAGLTMDRVASTVGLATGSLYNYFEDKNDLLQFFYTRLVEPFFQPIEEIARASCQRRKNWKGFSAPPGNMRSIIRASFGCLWEGIAAPSYDGTRILAFLRILTGIFEQGVREGAFGPHNPAHMGRMFQGCLSEVFDLLAEGRPTTN